MALLGMNWSDHSKGLEKTPPFTRPWLDFHPGDGILIDFSASLPVFVFADCLMGILQMHENMG
jgi:hypothetical protein